MCLFLLRTIQHLSCHRAGRSRLNTEVDHMDSLLRPQVVTRETQGTHVIYVIRVIHVIQDTVSQKPRTQGMHTQVRPPLFPLSLGTTLQAPNNQGSRRTGIPPHRIMLTSAVDMALSTINMVDVSIVKSLCSESRTDASALSRDIRISRRTAGESCCFYAGAAQLSARSCAALFHRQWRHP